MDVTRPGSTPAKLLHEAKNAAGDRAVKESLLGNVGKSREWQELSVEIDRLMHKVVRLMARV